MRTTLIIYEPPLIQVRGSLDVFFDRLLPRKLNESSGMDWRAKKLKEFIDSHPGRLRWNLDDVCKELDLAMSGRQARRLFKVWTGMGIRQYSKKTRVAYAAKQLQATNAPIKAIAADLGYGNTGHFVRSFKELLLLSPVEFRRVWRQRQFAA